MKIIHWPRGTGRTTELCKQAKRIGGIVITRDEKTAKRLSKEFGVTAYSWETFARDRRGDVERRQLSLTPLFVDDADYILEQVLKSRIRAAAFTFWTEQDMERSGMSSDFEYEGDLPEIKDNRNHYHSVEDSERKCLKGKCPGF